MRSSTIRSIAHALPGKAFTHEELEGRFGAQSVQGIRAMSGIRTRRVASAGECASDLALAAAQRLFSHTGVDRSSVDLLMFVSQTPDYRTPATASILQAKLGLAERCCTFDVNQSCGSFINALAIAHSMVAAGTSQRAVVLNADAITTLIHPRDRGLAAIHGDAAAAALVEPCEGPGSGFQFFEFGCDGTKFDKIYVPAGGARLPSSETTAAEKTDEDGCVRTQNHLVEDGRAVFLYFLYKMPEFVKGVLKKHNETLADYDMVLLNQANKTLIDQIYKGIGVPKEKRFYYMEEVGNSTGGSLPALLAEAWRQGVIKPGSRTLLAAFGGGLSWGAAGIRWPTDANAAVPGIVDAVIAATAAG